MRKLYIVLIPYAILFIISSCKKEDKHFISDPDYRSQVEAEFEKVKELANNRHEILFNVFEKDISTEEAEALKFLYAYMPLSDLANNTGEFYLQSVKSSFAARDSFSWGKDIPEDIFRHFVLPYRINNEDSDSSRVVFFRELLPRIKHMNIEQAALEVNHWCHEKVNYKSTDSRTMSPLGVVKTAYGRCGEESTFTVTALRAVGIPARQVYTPRWAHSDDNHAWVEVYINGTWKYLGACEPEAVLNKGWFDGPVLRAMMVHTKAFGKYKGSEPVLEKFEKYSILNLLANYAPVKPVYVKVLNADNKIITGATVEFGLYNYTRFYPLKKVQTDDKGLASITTGYGDLQIYCSDPEGNFEIQNITIEKVDTLEIILTKKFGNQYSLVTDNVPPINKVPEQIESTLEDLNKKKLVYEDSLRNAYINTFYDSTKTEILMNELNIEGNQIYDLLPETRGNHNEVVSFLKNVKPENKDLAVDMLKVLVQKDLHDVTEKVLNDHFDHFISLDIKSTDDISKKYILNPRISLEKLTSYKSYLQAEFEGSLGKNKNETVANIISRIKENIQIDDSYNYYKITLSPVGLYQLKISDEHSRDVFFVAILRSLGIPARIESATNIPQFYDNEWINVSFVEEKEQFIPAKATVSFKKNTKQNIEAQYRIHFSLAKLSGNEFTILEYGWGKKLSDLDKLIEIEPGYYQLIIGNRLQNGTILVHQEFFSIQEGEHKDLEIKLRQDQNPPKVLAVWKNANINNDLMIMGWIDPSSEPGKHFINNLKETENTYKKSKTPFELYSEKEEDLNSLKAKVISKIDLKIDPNFENMKSMLEDTKLSEKFQLPVFVIIDKKGQIFYFSEGYNIGTPEQILKGLEKIIR